MEEEKRPTLAEIQAALDVACAQRVVLALPFLQEYFTQISLSIARGDASCHFRIAGPLPPYIEDFPAFKASLMFAHHAIRDVRYNPRQYGFPHCLIIYFLVPVPGWPPSSFFQK